MRVRAHPVLELHASMPLSANTNVAIHVLRAADPCDHRCHVSTCALFEIKGTVTVQPGIAI
eukprot:7891030-Alexandrium_andersonii.AAC.1